MSHLPARWAACGSEMHPNQQLHPLAALQQRIYIMVCMHNHRCAASPHTACWDGHVKAVCQHTRLLAQPRQITWSPLQHLQKTSCDNISVRPLVHINCSSRMDYPSTSISLTATTTVIDDGAGTSFSKQAAKPIALQQVPNIRDLAEAFPAIQPGRVVRCAKPSDASPDDVSFLLDTLGIRELLDLRSAEELQEDLAGSALFARAAKLQSYNRSWITSSIALPQDAVQPHQVLHHQVSILDRLRYYMALLAHLPWRVTSYAFAMRLVGQTEAFRQTLLKDVNEGGLLLLYKMLVDSARPEICCALRVVTRALEQQRPVLMFCKAGKDRTGIMAMLLLYCAGASRDQILDDYHKSDQYHKVALAGIEKKEELKGLDMSVFERAPRQAMEGLLDYLDLHFGSVGGYLNSIGFKNEDQRRLRWLLTQPKLD